MAVVVGRAQGLDGGVGDVWIERRAEWGFGAELWWWGLVSGVVGAVVEKEKEGLEGVLRGGVYGSGCWGFVSEEVGNLGGR